MGRRLNIVFLATMAMAAMLQSSLAQTRYVVGDSLGWVVPPGANVYRTWAANKTFRVGDTLVFNFQNGAHNVARVNRANYDACNAGSPLLLLSNSPANVTLNETGAQYFLCGVPGHCNAGQKLAINVSAAVLSPAPQPSTPSPQPSPATPPSAFTPLPSPVPAPQVASPSPSPISSPPSPPSPTATPPSSSMAPTPPTAPSSPSPTGNGGTDSTPPTSGNSATSLGVASISTTFLSLIVAFFM